MSFDAFEARLQFLQLLRKLNASAQSIQKVVGFAVKYGSRCGEDLWEVIMDECEKGTLNTRINILYFLDSLLDISLSLGPPDAPYLSYIARDLKEVVERVVPDSREGVLNLKSAKQILDSWRTRRVIDTAILDSVLETLEHRARESETSPRKRGHTEAFSRNDILRRMEEDRERHKRLRERIWILPIPPLAPKSQSQAQPSLSLSNLSNPNPTPSPSSPFTPASPSTRPPPGSEKKLMPPPPAPPSSALSASGANTAGGGVAPLTALEVEFEQAWEALSDLDEDDLEKMRFDASRIAEDPEPDVELA